MLPYHISTSYVHVVPSLRTSFIVQIIVQIIFFFWSFETGEGVLRNQKIIIDLDSFSNHF